MIPIVEVAKGIFRIGPLDTKSRTPETSPFLVLGQRAAILEPGESGQAPDLLKAMEQLGVDLDRIDYLIASHIHLHHIAGVNVLLKEIPQVKMVVHQRGIPHLMEPTRLNASTTEVWGEGCPQISPVPQSRIWGVAGGEVIDLGGRELEIIETQGHAPHHISIFDRLTKALFPGDATGVFFGGPGTERTHPDILPPRFELDKAVDSLRRLRALKPSVLFGFGYNGTSFSPDKTLQWSEEDIRAVESICREGMEQKTSSQEIGRKVEEYYESVGVPKATPGGSTGSQSRGGINAMGGGPFGMYAYIRKQNPSLEMPK